MPVYPPVAHMADRQQVQMPVIATAATRIQMVAVLTPPGAVVMHLGVAAGHAITSVPTSSTGTSVPDTTFTHTR